jgi:beta-glucosidase
MFMANDGFLSFPEGFLWGVASAAYQIEGAVNEDGRGPSIWDTFSHQPGKTRNGETGDVAADHYHRWQEDLRIMKDLGVKVYRFSIAWPRILPTGSGQVNKPGLDFYDRLVDTLLDAGIEPFPTLYHWDLPQALQDRGGWPARDTARYFADYAQVVGERLGDRVNYWITHNEPWVAAFAGYFQGEHAPGIQDPVAAFLATHHLLLGHGLACEALRAACRNRPRVGIVLNLTPMHPATDSQADREAAARADAGLNRLFLDPLFKREYPPELIEQFGPIFTPPQPGDMERIAAPLDWLGVNYYSRHVVRYDPDEPITHLSQVQPVGNEYSQMWEIYPPGIYEMLTRVWEDYRPPFMIVTENGICVPDVPDLDGRIRDVRRIAYLHDHIAQVHRAIQEGVPVRGYFVWSLTDNFEWAHGYGMRFGLTYVDYATQARTVKESGWWYKGVIEANGVKSET